MLQSLKKTTQTMYVKVTFVRKTPEVNGLIRNNVGDIIHVQLYLPLYI